MRAARFLHLQVAQSRRYDVDMDRTRQETLQREGVEALRRGDPAAARMRFGAMANPPLMLLAQACGQLGDHSGEEAALRRHLAGDPRHLPALLRMGEIKASQGDERAATSFFHAAIGQAAKTPPPPALLPRVERARTFVNGAAGRFEAHLLASLRGAGLHDGGGRRRVRSAIDLLLGKVPLYQQQPTMFYFPELPQRGFYERAEFGWLAAVEAASDAIREELHAVMSDGADFPPYVEASADRPSAESALRGNADWGGFHFWKNGALVEENGARCPETLAALAGAPMPEISGRSPMALFSSLKPGTHIPPHNGMINTHLICHLPLIVPGKCGLRVGAEVREWEFGETLIFDDSIEHEAWNRSDRIRVVLLFEIWRPEITVEERAALRHLFEAIDHFGSVSAP
jgi:aspartyl/asparaginyl beta-hydroxylase (cupin superfamily)